MIRATRDAGDEKDEEEEEVGKEGEGERKDALYEQADLRGGHL